MGRSGGCETKFCHGRGICNPKPKDPRVPHICTCKPGFYGNYCEDQKPTSVFSLGPGSKEGKYSESVKKNKRKKVLATIGIVLLVILAVAALIAINVATKGECLNVFFQCIGSITTVFEVCFQVIAECCRQKTVSKEIEKAEIEAEAGTGGDGDERTKLLSKEKDDDSIEEDKEEKSKDGFFGRNLKRLIGWQTASQQATGLGFRLHKQATEGGDDDVLQSPFGGSRGGKKNKGQKKKKGGKGGGKKGGRNRSKPRKMRIRKE